MKRLLTTLTAGALLASSVAINAASNYTFTDVQAQFGERILVTSINDSGLIAGVRLNGFDYDIASTWDNHTETSLASPNGGISWGLGINDAGQVVGGSSGSNPFAGHHATYWLGSTATDLGTLGGLRSAAYDINDAGLIVGYSNTARGIGVSQEHATLWNGATMVDLGTLGGFSSHALAINDKGKIVGDSQIGKTGQTHATVWSGTHIIDLGTLPDSEFSYALDINNFEQVVGYSEVPAGSFRSHATLWDNGDIVDMGTLGGTISHASAINDHGQAVGQSYTTGNSDPHAFLWNHSQMIDLNSLLDQNAIDAGWILESAVDINNNGQIIGVAHNAINHQTTQFLLTPIVSPIPEPQTYCMLLVGLGLMGLRSLHKRNKINSTI